MTQNTIPGAAFLALAALVLAACVSQAAYNEQASQLQQTQAQIAAQQAEITKMQAENRWVMTGEGGYELSAAGQAALSQYVSQLRSLQNSKVVVYGFTDNLPVGPALQRAGIADNLDLSSRRAATVAAFLQSKGVNPNILSAKGFGAMHPVAPNDTPQGRAQNRRIEILLEGPGA